MKMCPSVSERFVTTWLMLKMKVPLSVNLLFNMARQVECIKHHSATRQFKYIKTEEKTLKKYFTDGLLHETEMFLQ